MRRIFYYVFAVLSFLLIFSCGKHEKQVSNLANFSDYISTYSKELITTTDKIEVELVKPVLISTLPKNVISVYPKVVGTVFMEGNKLIFSPKKTLTPNTVYTITVHLSKLYTINNEEQKDFVFKVKTKRQLFTVHTFSVQSYNSNWNYIDGFIKVSNAIETQKMPQLLKATYQGKTMPIQFDIAEKRASKIAFTIDSIPRLKTDSFIKLFWDGTVINTSLKGEKKIVIAGKDNFKILDIKVLSTEGQRIEISFSDPIDPSQNLYGLIAFRNNHKASFTYKINNNVVTLYPKKQFKKTTEINLFKGIKNINGNILKEDNAQTLIFEQPKPIVKFLQSGTILPTSNNLKINFSAINLRAVDVTVFKIYKDNMLQFLQTNKLHNTYQIRYVGRPITKQTINLANKGLQLDTQNAFAIDLADFITPEAGAMYRVSLNYEKAYTNYLCNGEKSTSPIIFGEKDTNTPFYNTPNYYSTYNYNNYNWDERENPCSNSYYYNKEISKNILASNLGVTVKKGLNNSIFIAATNLITAQPVNNAKVVLVNLQQQELQTTKTASDGVAKFENAQQAFFVIVSKGNNVTYVKLDDGEVLSTSKFDVSGVKIKNGIKGYLYTERGVRRPGDNIYTTFVLNDKDNPIPQGHPIKFELIDPRGKIIAQKIIEKNASNVYVYTAQTNPNAPTGNWKIKTSVGSATFNKIIKVETIKPNRLKIKLTTKNKLVKQNENIKGTVNVTWLHGAIAKNLKIDINGKIKPLKTSFKGFENYEFDDVTKKFKTEEFPVFKGSLNNEGKTTFTIKPSLSNKPSGMLKASYITKVYENGGDFSTDVFSQKISPFKNYVGIEVAEEKESKNYLYTNKDYIFNIASVSENGSPVKLNEVDVKIYKIDWRWWWNTTSENLSRYSGANYHRPYKQVKLKTTYNGKGRFKLKVDENDWGRYLIKVTDKKGKHSSAKIVYFDWPSWDNKKKNNPSGVTVLNFTTNKEHYKVTEQATVQFPSSEGQRALITIENGTQVLEHFWVTTQKKQTTFNFPILKKYTPNVYVNISLLQKHNETKNNLPIRMYGTVPILVEDSETKLQPIITIADEIKPEQTTTIKVSEANGKPLTYTVALVDEGLLDLTRFKTPNPWNAFYAKQSLGVKTWDVFDEVIGAYGGKINQILSIGGDENEAGSKNKKANRFKPMVTFLGPFNLETGSIKTHTITVPKYIGSVRAMVVASNAKTAAYGSVEKKVFVRKPLMVLASLPRKITPKETVTLPVTVFAMKKHIKNVLVQIKPNSAFTIVGKKTKQLSFNNPNEKMVYFDLKINDFKGIAKVQVETTSGKEKASYAVDLNVLNPNPITTKTYNVVVKPNQEKTINFNSFGAKGTNKVSLELSSLPPINFTERMGYLIQYPHGCVEQVTSSVFPQLFLSDLFDLSTSKIAAIDNNIKAAITKLAGFQKANGGLSYWQGANNTNDWGTSYAGHFLLEAENKGYVMPIGFKNNWVAYQKQQARNWRNNNGNDLAQAYRLYTLALANTPDLASMNRLRETPKISANAGIRLAMAYALIGKKSIAMAILNAISTVNYQDTFYNNYGSKIRNKAMALQTYTALENTEKSILLAKELAKYLSSNQWMSTQTTAFSLLAMAKYIIKNQTSKTITATYVFNKKLHKVTATKSFIKNEFSTIKNNNTMVIKNTSKGVLYAIINSEGILPVGLEDVYKNNLEVQVRYKTKNGDPISIEKLQQGTNFLAEVWVSNQDINAVKDLALTQILPSGWEIINTRFTDFNTLQNTNVDYTDIRDDRVNYYFSLSGKQSKTFTILLNASYLGNYYLPGTQVTAMYNSNYTARTKGQWVQVVK